MFSDCLLAQDCFTYIVWTYSYIYIYMTQDKTWIYPFYWYEQDNVLFWLFHVNDIYAIENYKIRVSRKQWHMYMRSMQFWFTKSVNIFPYTFINVFRNVQSFLIFCPCHAVTIRDKLNSKTLWYVEYRTFKLHTLVQECQSLVPLYVFFVPINHQ